MIKLRKIQIHKHSQDLFHVQFLFYSILANVSMYTDRPRLPHRVWGKGEKLDFRMGDQISAKRSTAGGLLADFKDRGAG